MERKIKNKENKSKPVGEREKVTDNYTQKMTI